MRERSWPAAVGVSREDFELHSYQLASLLMHSMY